MISKNVGIKLMEKDERTCSFAMMGEVVLLAGPLDVPMSLDRRTYKT